MVMFSLLQVCVLGTHPMLSNKWWLGTLGLLVTIGVVAWAIVIPCETKRPPVRFNFLRYLPLSAMIVVAAGVMWLLQPESSVAWAALSTPGAVIGIWAGVVWWRNRVLEQQIDQLNRHYSQHDHTTGLWNHRTICDHLQEQLKLASPQRLPVAVLCIDIERFALFNRTYGHSVGDDLLRWVGGLLVRLLPPNAIIGRYGGDEFLVVLPGATRSQAQIIAARLQQYLSERVVGYPLEDQRIPLSLSIGYASFPEDAEDVPSLLRSCEEALEVARRSASSALDSVDRWLKALHAGSSYATLQAMVVAIDKKDHYTLRHSLEVQQYAMWLAEELDLPEPQRRLLHLAALVHDIGKIAIPDEILMKPGTLTAEEYETMKQHSELGAIILSALPEMKEMVPIVRAHHERWDGRGYPDGLAGEEIPLLARVLSVADAFSAMTADRPYRKGMDWQEALLELQRQSGKQFDPMLVEAFIRAVSRHETSSFRLAA